MIRALDAANFFVDLAKSKNTDMTNLRVNKLLYFAQGWSLVRTGKPLFNDEIEAWDLGPVVPEVYVTFKPCGRERIQDTSDGYDYESLSSSDIDLLLDVSDHYEKYATSYLVDMSHEPCGPWEKHHVPHGSNIIPKDELRAFFSSADPIEEYKLPEAPASAFIGFRDSDGYLVLPKEYEDA